jgi:hypothetical protein
MNSLVLMRLEKGAGMDPSLFVSVAEFGRQFSISKSKASEMVLGGRVKSAFIDGRRVIPREEVNRLADELRQNAGVMVAV